MDATSNATNQPTWDDYWKVKNWGYTTSYTGTSWDLKEDLRWDLKEVLTSKRPFFGVPCSFSKVYRLPIHCFIWTLTLDFLYEYAQAASRRWWQRWWGKHHRQRINYRDRDKDMVLGGGVLGGGFKHFLFSPLFGEDVQFDENIFQMGWNHRLLSKCFKFFRKELPL